MIRLLTFAIVFALIGIYLHRLSRPASASRPVIKIKKAKVKKRSQKKLAQSTVDSFWTQVYDTDSSEDALKIRHNLSSLGIDCLIYEQGKKDIYGDTPKHFGISVPKHRVQEAQARLAEMIL